MSFVRAWVRERRSVTIRLATVALVCGAAIWSSVHAGTPVKLPDVAMGWLLLFHVERAIVLLAAIGAVVLVSWRATHGDFPVKLGHLEYAVRETAKDIEGRNEALEARMRILEALVRAQHPRGQRPGHE